MWISRSEYERLKTAADHHEILMERQKSDSAVDRHELQERCNKHENNLKIANEEVRKLKEMVREQTNADLLVVGLKAVGIIKTREQKNWSAVQENLLAQQRAISGFGQGMDHPTWGLLGGLGGLLGNQYGTYP